jgi:hypothetical protein
MKKLCVVWCSTLWLVVSFTCHQHVNQLFWDLEGENGYSEKGIISLDSKVNVLKISFSLCDVNNSLIEWLHKSTE